MSITLEKYVIYKNPKTFLIVTLNENIGNRKKELSILQGQLSY